MILTSLSSEEQRKIARHFAKARRYSSGLYSLYGPVEIDRPFAQGKKYKCRLRLTLD